MASLWTSVGQQTGKEPQSVRQYVETNGHWPRVWSLMNDQGIAAAERFIVELVRTHAGRVADARPKPKKGTPNRELEQSGVSGQSDARPAA